VKKQGEMPLPSLGPIPLKNVEFRDGMLLACEIFRVQEMHSQLEVTEMLERKVNLTA